MRHVTLPTAKYAGKDLVIKRVNHPDFLKEQRDRITEAAAEHLANGKTLQQAADEIGITRGSLAYLRRSHPLIKRCLEDAAFEGSDAILEQMRDTPFTEIDPARARVKIEALVKYLEMRWPDRYGKRIDVKVTEISLGDALQRAKARAGLVIDAVKSTTYAETATDDESVADEPGLDALF